MTFTYYSPQIAFSLPTLFMQFLRQPSGSCGTVILKLPCELLKLCVPTQFSSIFRISRHTVPAIKTFFLIQLRHIISSIYKSICHLLNISSQNEQFITTCSLKINFIYRSHCRFLLWPRVAFQSINNSFNFTIRAKSESIITVSYQTVCRTIIT